MPAPGLFADGEHDPFVDGSPIESLPDFSILYATLREPAGEDDRQHFYKNERGTSLRAGMARVEVGRKTMTWEEARRVSLAKNRVGSYPLRVTEAKEIGILEASIFAPREIQAEEEIAIDRFAEEVNDRLAKSHKKDVYVYVHGYRVAFENPLLVASELWHFLGYEGTMIAFSWPSTPSKWAYYADAETAAWSARGFRRFLAILAEETEAERIHIVAYSAGTRMVSRALDQIALMYQDETHEEIFAKRRLGEVLLVGSDVDRQLIAAYIEDGFLDVPERMTIYLSAADRALGVSRWLLGGADRVGQSWGEEGPGEVASEMLWELDRLTVVDVTGAEAYSAGNGHAYFRKSPWVSSDVLMILGHHLTPDERGLVREESSAIWRFPPDYIARLRAALERVLPGGLRKSE
jgi:esterase/lipase superfamily enzyme